MHLPPLILDLAIILGVAGLMNLIFQRIHQPVVLGYLIAGVLIGPHTPPFQLVSDLPSIRTWAELGVIFLMFSLGLEFSFRKLAKVGVPSLMTALVEIPCMLIGGYALGRLFGWSVTDSIFLAAAVSISSTTIIIKALDELKLKTYRFAELVFGLLIVEDLIAILLIVGLSVFVTTGEVSTMTLVGAAGKLTFVVGGWMLAGYFIVPRLMKYASRYATDEMITLLSLGLCLGLVAFAAHFHYSAALGAFIMGSILAETPSLPQVERLIRPLKDLFGAVFFVSIGILIDPAFIWMNLGKVLILCSFVIGMKILSVSMGALLSGQTFRNSMRMGFTHAQIGEFSFIIMGVGVSVKATSEFLYPVAVAVSLVTTFTTPYLIRVAGPFSEMLERRLPPGLQAILLRYARWSETRWQLSGGASPYAAPAKRWVINALITSLIFLGGAHLMRPWLQRNFEMSGLYSATTAWATAAVLSAPFLWGMFSAFSGKRRHGLKHLLAPVFIARLFMLIMIGLLSVEFFPGRYVALSIALVLFVMLVISYRRLEIYYRWYEQRFLSSFDQGHQTDGKWPVEGLHHLAPWDAHLVSIQVHPNSPLVTKRLGDAHLRRDFGVNIVAIRRGEATLVAPSPQEVLLPGDEVVLLGNDSQVDAIRPVLENPRPGQVHLDSSEYQLHQATVGRSSFIIGRSIRESGLRENFHCLVVGVERRTGRVINPDSGFIIEAGDVLWVVGEHQHLERLYRELAVH